MHTYTKIIHTCTIHIHRIPAVVCFVFLLHISRTEVIIILHTRIQLLFHLCMYWVCVSKTINKWCVVYSTLFVLSTPPPWSKLTQNIHRLHSYYSHQPTRVVYLCEQIKRAKQNNTSHHITSRTTTKTRYIHPATKYDIFSCIYFQYFHRKQCTKRYKSPSLPQLPLLLNHCDTIWHHKYLNYETLKSSDKCLAIGG